MAFNKFMYDFVFFLTFLCLTNCSQKCTNAFNDYENHLATKSPYRIVANYNATEVKYDGCEATKLWALVRHGTRNPSLKFVDKMKTRLVEIRDLILENSSEGAGDVQNLDLDLFHAWSVKVKDKDQKKLTHEGEDEMLLLAERLQKRFPNVLTNIYSDSSHKFKYTATQRTKRSAEYFAAGLFGKAVVRDVQFPEPLKSDPVLRFYKLCDKWRKEIKKNPAALAELKKFFDSDIMAKTIKAVNQKLGFDDELNQVDVHTMYMTCAFETAWNKRKRSPWCSAFSIDDFKVMEYAEDLKYYWIDGYGHELTYKQACKAFNDLTEFLQNNETYPKSTVYFTHSGTLLKMLAHMEMYKEKTHLVADDFEKNLNRNWRVSQLDAFGTNLVFILFNCQGQEKVLTLHQENVVRLPACVDSDLCDFKKFVEHYKGDGQCPFDQMCDNSL